MNESMLKKITTNQKNLERVLDNLKDGIIAHDLQRRIFYVNKTTELITGFSRDEIIGKDCHEAMGGPFCGENCKFCGEEPSITDSAEYSMNITTKNGETRHVEMLSTMMKTEEGENFGILATFRDVTDLFDLKMKAAKLTSFSNIIGQDKKMLDVFKQIRDVAKFDFPVCIYGETGTGKELVANAVHNESPRSGAPFVPINCGALPEGLIESELFGHMKGSFSGAIRDKRGRFELANNGTVFLDEVAELPKLLQVKLLRFLQEGTFEKVGSEKSVSVNVRIISATNKDLVNEVKTGNFRDDLYYRLKVIPISIPPIRHRKTDIPLLVDHFLNLYIRNDTKPDIHVSKEAMRRIMEYQWPGNVRELQNAIQFAIVKCRGNVIEPEDLPMELIISTPDYPSRGPARKLDIDAVKSALHKTGGNKARAARLLGVGRATLYRFFNDHPELFSDNQVYEIPNIR